MVKPAPPPTNQAPPDGAPLQLLLKDVQVKLGPDGDSEFTETRMKLLKPEALAAGNIRLEWDPQIQSITIHRLTVTHAGKVTDVLAGQKFTVVQREQALEAAMLDGRLTATLQISGLEVGDEIDIATTEEQHDPVLAGHSQFAESLPQTAIAGRVRVRALWPATDPVVWKMTDDVPKAIPHRAGSLQEVAFEADGMGPVIPTDGAPARYRVRRVFQASSFAQWKDISALMAPLYAAATALKPDSPIKAEAAKIKAAAADPATRMLLALQLVQNQTRYVYVGLDSGAYHPAAADDTWTRRWGDCKAKTALLLSILSELGIEADPILANGGGLESAEGLLPLMAAFDHVLVRAKVGGKSYYLDGTRVGDTNLEELESFSYGVGLPVRAGGAGLETLVAPIPKHPTVTTVMRIDASAGLRESAKVDIHLEFRGPAGFEVDRQFAAIGRDQAQQAMKSAMTKSMPWLEVSGVTWSYEPRRRIFSEDIRGAGKVDWSKDVGGGASLWYELSDSEIGKLRSLRRSSEQDQAAPYAVTFPFYTRSVATFRLPPSIQSGRRGENVAMTYGGVRYTRRVFQAGDTVVMYRGSRSLGPEISAKEAAADEARRPDINTGAAWIWAVPSATASGPKAATVADGKGPTASKPAMDEKALVAAALIDARDGLYDKARDEVVRALAIKPGWADALRASGFIYYSQGRYSDAADAFAETIKASSTPDEALFLARLTDLSLAGRLDEAVQAGDAALAAFPKSDRIRLERAVAFSRRREYAKALAEVDEALRLSASDPSLPVEKADLLWLMGRRDEALKLVEATLSNDPDSVQARTARGLYLERLKSFEEARDDLEEAQKMNPEDQAAVARLADLDAKRGNFAGAIGRLDAGLSQWPTSTLLLNSRCWIRAMSGDQLDLALKDCDAALVKSPKYAAAMDSRAFVSFRQKKFADAIERYNAVLKMRPDQADSLYGRGLAKLRAGDQPGGEADLALAVKLSPDVAETFSDMGVRP